MFVIDGLGAAIFEADMEWNEYTQTPYCKVPAIPKIYWEDASEEERKTGNWITFYNKSPQKYTWSQQKYKFREHTEAELQELENYEIKRLKGMYKYLLDNYGWIIAQDFYNTPEWNKKFKNYNLKMENNLPHCKYTEEGQCNLFCDFYTSNGCQWTPESEDCRNDNNL